VPTVRRQADEIIRLKSDGVRPSEIASKLGIGRASVYRVLGSQGRLAMIRWQPVLSAA
jgi:DNA invertase Pin-like site-specific DNA recombinase